MAQSRASSTGVTMYYGAGALFLSMIHNVFLLYHVDVFVSVFSISQEAFVWVELAFLLWNSINDYVYGWLADRQSLMRSTGHVRISRNTLISRTRALEFGGPLMAVAFLLFWFRWTLLPSWVQLAVCLGLYDGLLTWVDLCYNALVADLALSDEQRSDMGAKASAFSLAGSASVLLSHLVYDRTNLANFRLMCLMLAAISGYGFHQVGKKLRQYASTLKKDDERDGDSQSASSTSFDMTKSRQRENQQPSMSALLVKSWQLISGRNFFWFSLLNLIQVFHCHFNSNFFPLFLSVLLGPFLPSSYQSVILAVSFALPHINNIYFSKLVGRHGVYIVIAGLLITKTALGLLAMLSGMGAWPVLALVVASNRVFTEGTCKLLNLALADIVDEDYVMHERAESASAFVFGTASLLSKPGQTIAPLVGTYIISQASPEALFSSNGIISTPGDETGDAQENVASALFGMLVWVPICCGLVQLVAWSQYTLHGGYLAQIKRAVISGWRGIEIV